MLEVNFLSWREQKIVVNNNIFYFYLVLSFCVVSIIISIVCFINIKEKNAVLLFNNNLQHKLQELAADVQGKQSKLKDKEIFYNGTNFIRNIYSRRDSVLTIFIDLATNIPNDIYFTSLQISQDKAIISGITSSSTAINKLLHKLQQLQWCEGCELSVESDKFVLYIARCLE